MTRQDSTFNYQNEGLESFNLNRLRGIIFLCLQGLQTRAQSFWQHKRLPHLFNRQLAWYLRKLGKNNRHKLRVLLHKKIEIHPAQLSHFFHSPMGEEILAQADRFIKIADGSNEKYTLRAALLKTASDPQGLSVLNLLRKFSHSIHINTDRLLMAAERVELLFAETRKMVGAIARLSKQEARLAEPVDFTTQADLRQTGSLGVTTKIMTLYDWQRQRQLRVTLYRPQTWRSGKTPVVTISHGLAAQPEDMREYAEHLASYGYFVAVPQHLGSDSNKVRNLLAGNGGDVFEIEEFIDRPLDITFLLDELEKRNTSHYEGRLDLNRVGVMGHSFGGYTALALAGAEMNFHRLEQACGPIFNTPNMSLIVQCRALRLPRQTYDFRDPRVKAVLPIEPVGSEVFGAIGLKQVKIPMLIFAGSEDRTAQVLLEQIRIFSWLTHAQSYLALIQGKSHVTDVGKLIANWKLHLKHIPQVNSERIQLYYQYTNALSLAFFEVYLTQDEAYQQYLQSNYANYISHKQHKLYFLSSSAIESLKPQLQEFKAKMSALQAA